MNLLQRLSHEFASVFYKRSYLAFLQGMPLFKEQQKKKLKQLLPKTTSYEEFKKQYPLTDYSHYSELIENQKKDPQLIFHPTSGSTHQRKWIPYTDALKNEFDAGISPWLGDLFRSYPAIKKGKHYWSLSWIPDDMRKHCSSDDVEVMPWWKKIFIKNIMAVPSGIQSLPTSRDSILASLVYLCSSQDLSLISVWSPTYLISMLEELKVRKEEVISILEEGKWTYPLKCPQNNSQAKILRDHSETLNKDFLKKLWPQLALISCWDTGSSQVWADQLKKIFPHVSFQGKGLLTTEAVITIPFHHKTLLAYNSHFYEFLDSSDQTVKASWELKINDKVSPIVTTGSGFIRYKIPDLLRVEDFYNGNPILRFLGRMRDIDLVGEKLSPETAEQLFEHAKGINSNFVPISLIAVQCTTQKSYYVLLIESQDDKVSDPQVVDHFLKSNYHYSLARDLGQLQEAKIMVLPQARQFYFDLFERKGMVAGEIKIESLTLINEEIWNLGELK